MLLPDALAVAHGAETGPGVDAEAGRVFGEDAGLQGPEAAGFRQVGFREKIGKMNGTWRDTLLLERRSPKVGTD